MLKGLGQLGDMAKLMKHAQEMQSRMADAQNRLDDVEVVGEAGAGLVKVTATAKGAVKGLAIDPTLFVPDESPDMDRQVDRARWAESRGAALLHRVADDEAHLSAALGRLLRPDVQANLATACAGIAEAGDGWRNGAETLAHMLEGSFEDGDAE